MHIYYYSAFTNCSFLASRNRKMKKQRILLSGNTRSTLMTESEEELKSLLIKVKEESEEALACPTLSNPMDYSLPGSSVLGIFQARVLEWGAIAFSIS